MSLVWRKEAVRLHPGWLLLSFELLLLVLRGGFTAWFICLCVYY